MLRALQCAASGGGQGANTCDKCATDLGSLRCTWIHKRGGLHTLDASLQRLLFRVRARARRWLGRGERGHLGALRAPVAARRRGGEHHVALPAEVAGAREVGGQGPGVEAAEPEILQLLAKGVPEIQQAGADAAPVISTKQFSPDRLPCVVREYPVVVEGCYEVIPRRAVVPLGVVI